MTVCCGAPPFALSIHGQKIVIRRFIVICRDVGNRDVVTALFGSFEPLHIVQ
jgi:hypothetical protein